MVMKHSIFLSREEHISAFASKVPGIIFHLKGISYADNSGSYIMINYVIYMNHHGKYHFLFLSIGHPL
jgi:hypothetical protein